MANPAELVVAYYACFHIGAIAAPLNTRLKTAELRPLLERLRPALYIGQADLYQRIAAIDASIVPPNARFIVGAAIDDRWAQPLTKLLEEGKVGPLRNPPDVYAPAVLLTTSGTTGQPKFVTHTQTTLAASADAASHLGLDDDDIAAIALPMAHGFGLFAFLACIEFGAPVVLLERFDPDVMLEAIERHRCTWLPPVPAMFAALLERQQARGRNVRSLRVCLASGDVCPSRLQEQFFALFGTRLRSFWGATEAAGSLTYGLASGPVSRMTRSTSAGKIFKPPRMMTSFLRETNQRSSLSPLRIKSPVRNQPSNGAPVPKGDVGELALRGPNVTIGYWAGPGLIEDAPKRSDAPRRL